MIKCSMNKYSEHSIVETVYNTLKDTLPSGAYDFSKEVSVKDYGIDLMVSLYGIDFAAIEVKTKIDSDSISDIKQRLFKFINENKVCLAVITDGERVYFCHSSKEDWKKCRFQDLCRIFEKVYNDVRPYAERDLQSFYDKFSSTLNKYVDRIPQLKSFLEKINIGSIDLDEKYNECFLNDDTERQFFFALLKNTGYETLNRYSSLESLFRMIDQKRIGMCSIVCMNDKSEIDFADKYINNKNITAYSNENFHYEKEIESSNNCYILSCVSESKEDDLTMWRLYGDNAYGANIIFKIDNQEHKNDDFVLCNVCYADKDGVCPELDLIAELKEHHFYFRKWHIWKHFFKPQQFKDEQEIRLFYYSQGDETCDEVETKWIKNADNHIVSKIKLFPMEGHGFPLHFCKALIGPKINEKEKVAEQFAFMAMEKLGPEEICISQSSIEVYR